MSNGMEAALALAAGKADKSDEAATLIQQAGQGLMDVFNAAKANTVTLATFAKLQVVQGFLSEAGVSLLEAYSLSEEGQTPTVPRIKVVGGD